MVELEAFSYPWFPRDDGMYPDPVCTCLICGAVVDARYEDPMRSRHYEWHEKHGDVEGEVA